MVLRFHRTVQDSICYVLQKFSKEKQMAWMTIFLLFVCLDLGHVTKVAQTFLIVKLNVFLKVDLT